MIGQVHQEYFKDFVEERAFIDKIVLNISGERREKPLAAVISGRDTGIGSAENIYTRKLPLTVSHTGDTGFLLYGRLHGYLDKFQLTLAHIHSSAALDFRCSVSSSRSVRGRP